MYRTKHYDVLDYANHKTLFVWKNAALEEARRQKIKWFRGDTHGMLELTVPFEDTNMVISFSFRSEPKSTNIHMKTFLLDETGQRVPHSVEGRTIPVSSQGQWADKRRALISFGNQWVGYILTEKKTKVSFAENCR